MSDIEDKVREALAFLSPDEAMGVLQGTLERIEEEFPGYVDHLILGVLSIRAGFKPNPYGNRGEI